MALLLVSYGGVGMHWNKRRKESGEMTYSRRQLGANVVIWGPEQQVAAPDFTRYSVRNCNQGQLWFKTRQSILP